MATSSASIFSPANLDTSRQMTKQHCIALADSIRAYNAQAFPAGTNIASPLEFTHTQIQTLADFCAAQNPAFDRERWLAYVAGECGPNGGKRKG